MGAKSCLILATFSYLLLFGCFATAAMRTSKRIRARNPCKNLVFYFHDIIYNGHNSHNATAAIVGAPAWGNRTILAGQNHFGNLVVFDDPITLDNNLHSTPVGRAQGFYIYDKKDIFTAWLGFSFVFNSTEHKGSINFAGADPLMNKTRDISVIGGTGDFFMTRGVATLMTDSFEGEVYFRLRVDIKLNSRKQCRELNGGRLGNFLCRVCDSAKGSECRTSEGRSCNGTKLLHCAEDCSIMIRKKNRIPSIYQGFNLPLQSHLKFMILCGLFTLQGAQQALAGSDIASQLLGDPGDISTGFASAFLLIFFSELGDKTFFIAAILAARNSAGVVFLGTFGALAAMTIISVVIGRTFHYVDDILPFRFGDADLPIDDIAAACLLVYFGVSTLLDASSGDSLKAEEEQQEAELAVSEFSGNGAGILAAASTVISTFLIVFVAEWGDKSFFSTIALAAASSPLGVVGGAIAGHGVATLVAVLGGSLLGTFLSEKVIAYIGGTLFLVFAAVTLIEVVS